VRDLHGAPGSAREVCYTPIAMAASVKKLLQAARDLSEADRVRLAEQLLASVDDGPPAEIAAAWTAEIERRARELDEGTVRPVPWTEVKASLRRARGRR
jgi:putative addiction module component (TIGR02574 family)